MVNVKSKAYIVAKYALMLATIFVAMMLDRAISVGLPISTAAVTILVTFSFCFLENDWATGVLAATFFGVASFFKEFIFPSSVSAFPVYVWPLITVVPRVAMGAVAFAVYKALLLITRKMKNAYVRQTVAITIAVFLGNVANTVLFLSALNIAKRTANMDYTPLLLVIKGALLTNIVPEYLISMILAPHVALGVRRGLKLGLDGNNWKLAAKDEANVITVQADAQTELNEDDAICGEPTADKRQNTTDKGTGENK